MIFLIDYDGGAGKLRVLKEFPDHQRCEAQKERLDIELSARGPVFLFDFAIPIVLDASVKKLLGEIDRVKK